MVTPDKKNVITPAKENVATLYKLNLAWHLLTMSPDVANTARCDDSIADEGD